MMMALIVFLPLCWVALGGGSLHRLLKITPIDTLDTELTAMRDNGRLANSFKYADLCAHH